MTLREAKETDQGLSLLGSSSLGVKITFNLRRISIKVYNSTFIHVFKYILGNIFFSILPFHSATPKSYLVYQVYFLMVPIANPNLVIAHRVTQRLVS